MLHNSAGALFLPAHDPNPHLHRPIDARALEQVSPGEGKLIERAETMLVLFNIVDIHTV